MKRMRGSLKAATTLCGSSADPSSTTTISKSWQLCPSTERMAVPRTLARLKAGMITEKCGSVAMDHRIFVVAPAQHRGQLARRAIQHGQRRQPAAAYRPQKKDQGQRQQKRAQDLHRFHHPGGGAGLMLQQRP